MAGGASIASWRWPACFAYPVHIRFANVPETCRKCAANDAHTVRFRYAFSTVAVRWRNGSPSPRPGSRRQWNGKTLSSPAREPGDEGQSRKLDAVLIDCRIGWLPANGRRVLGGAKTGCVRLQVLASSAERLRRRRGSSHFANGVGHHENLAAGRSCRVALRVGNVSAAVNGFDMASVGTRPLAVIRSIRKSRGQ
jgi:hypothetical protein